MPGFPVTRGSMLDAVRSPEPSTRARGLETLAAAYWRPVYTHIRFGWRRSHEEASDLTQEFFARVVEKDLLDRFDPAKARLRTYLRIAIDGLVANEAKAAARQKRGGGAAALSLDFEPARRAFDEGGGVNAALSPEELFEREWVRSLFTMAVERFREECAASGREARFSLLTLHDLEPEEPRPSYSALAARLGLSETDVTNGLAAGRRDLRRIVLQLLRELTGSEEEFRREARTLLGVTTS